MTDGRKEHSREELARLMEQYGSRLLRMCALYLRDAPWPRTRCRTPS